MAVLGVAGSLCMCGVPPVFASGGSLMWRVFCLPGLLAALGLCGGPFLLLSCK